jgi:hypothetical protein
VLRGAQFSAQRLHEAFGVFGKLDGDGHDGPFLGDCFHRAVGMGVLNQTRAADFSGRVRSAPSVPTMC